MPAEHLNEKGQLCRGYYCPKCGQGGLGMYGHSRRPCRSNPEKVKKMNAMNRAGSPEQYVINKLAGKI